MEERRENADAPAGPPPVPPSETDPILRDVSVAIAGRDVEHDDSEWPVTGPSDFGEVGDSDESDRERTGSEDEDRSHSTAFYQSAPSFVPRYPVSAAQSAPSTYGVPPPPDLPFHPDDWRQLPLQRWTEPGPHGKKDKIAASSYAGRLGTIPSSGWEDDFRVNHGDSILISKDNLENAKKAKEEAEKVTELLLRAKKEAAEAWKEIEGVGNEAAQKDPEKAAKERTQEAKPKRYEEAPEPRGSPNSQERQLLKFIDAVGRRFHFPFDAVKTWQGMEYLIKQSFLHVDVIGSHVSDGHYDLTGPEDEIILPQVWDALVRPGWTVKMLMWPMPAEPPSVFDAPPPPPQRQHAKKGRVKNKPKQPPDRDADADPEKIGRIPPQPPPPPPLPLGPPPPQDVSRLDDIVMVESEKRKKTTKSSKTFASWILGDKGKPDSKDDDGTGRKLPYDRMVTELAKHMPHLSHVRNNECRAKARGRIFCYDTPQGGGHPTLTRELDPTAWLNDSPKALAELLPPRTGGPPTRTILVEDLSPSLIKALGSVFWMNPECFEEHLNRSGYREGSYKDPHPRTWNTNASPKDYASIYWYRPVHRLDVKPGSENERERLLSTHDFLKTSDHTIEVHPNIFRKEWTFITDPDKVTPGAESTIRAAWEEKATMYRTKIHNCSIFVILLDPLPRLSYVDSYGNIELRMPYKSAYSRGPLGPGLGMVGAFNRRKLSTAEIDRLGLYLNATKSTQHDLTHWISELQSFDSQSEMDLITGLLWVVHRDTTGFLCFVSAVLEEIGLESTDDYLMQNRVSHWRKLISRFQVELPEMRASLSYFFRLATDSELQFSRHAAAPFINSTLTAIDILIGQNEKSYQALRADLAVLENKRGIAEAESVGKLTELAFIFIPLTFVAALFSMNVEQLRTPVPLYPFIIGSVVTVGLAYTARLTIRSAALVDFKREQYTKIRRHADLPSGSRIPNRAFLAYVFRRRSFEGLRRRREPAIRGALVVLVIAILMVPIALIWTHKYLDVGFKTVLTLLIFVFDATVVSFLVGWPGLALDALHRRESTFA